MQPFRALIMDRTVAICSFKECLGSNPLKVGNLINWEMFYISYHKWAGKTSSYGIWQDAQFSFMISVV